jgi:hypothetical protein
MSDHAATDPEPATTSASVTSSPSPIIAPTPSTISIDPEDEAIMEEARENAGSTEEPKTHKVTDAKKKASKKSKKEQLAAKKKGM